MSSGKPTHHAMMADSCQGHRRDAAALLTIRISAKLTWIDVSFEIGGDGLGGSSEDAFFWISGRGGNLSQECFGHIQSQVFQPQLAQGGDHSRSLRGSQYLPVGCAALGSEDTEPHLSYLRTVRPESEEFVEVSGALRDLRCDGAVNVDLRTLNVFEDAVVGGGFAALIVFGLQAVDGDHDIQFPKLHPRGRNFSECAGDDLGVDTAALDLWQEQIEFAIANERIATDQGDMERTMLVDQGEHSPHQFVAFKVRELAKLGWTAKMSLVEGVASGAAQGAFLGDLDGKRRCMAGKDSGPGA